MARLRGWGWLVVLVTGCGHAPAPAASASRRPADAPAPAAEPAPPPRVPSREYGCGGAPRPIEAWSTREGPSCAVRGRTTIDEITVAPSGASPFLVSIKDVPATVRIGDHPGELELDVAGALVFHGRARRAPIRFERSATLAGGLVHVARGARVITPRMDGSRLVAALEIGELAVEDAPIPCDALGLGPAEPPPRVVPTRERGWAVRGDSPVRLFASPGAPPSILVRPFLAPADQIDPSGWVHVLSGDASGSVQGWVRRTDVEWSEDVGGGGRGEGIGLCGGCGCIGHAARATCAGPGCDPNDVDRWGYEGRATLEADAPVFAEPGRGEWARVAKTVDLEIDLAPHERWVQLRSARGITDPDRDCCDTLSRAFVPRDRVRIPRR